MLCAVKEPRTPLFLIKRPQQRFLSSLVALLALTCFSGFFHTFFFCSTLFLPGTDPESTKTLISSLLSSNKEEITKNGLFIQSLLHFLLLFKKELCVILPAHFAFTQAGVRGKDEPKSSLSTEKHLMRPGESITELITDSGRISASCLNRPRRRWLEEQRRRAVTVKA